jgi:division protein CdvB (Snf7/Vps24/ESCRT-III family)
MKVSRVDISPTMQSTCMQLETIKNQIGDEVSHLNETELVSAITILHQGSNQLAREINQSVEIAPVDATLKKKLFNLIQTIQHSAAFSQALGPHQVELMGVFRRIETSIEKAEQKVTKVDTDPLRRQ